MKLYQKAAIAGLVGTFNTSVIAQDSLLTQIRNGPVLGLQESLVTASLQPFADRTFGSAGLLTGTWGDQLNAVLIALNAGDVPTAISSAILDPEPALSGASVLMTELSTNTLPSTMAALNSGNFEILVDALAEDYDALSFGSTPQAVNDIANGVITADQERVDAGMTQLQHDLQEVIIPSLIGPDT